ncbi:MAG: hypothetical protein ACPG4T_02545 [Nannocystaceae bacterium]
MTNPQRSANDRASYEKLRSLLIDPERDRIESLDARVAELEGGPKPEDLRLALLKGQTDPRLQEILTPPVQKALHRIVADDPQPIADALAPVIAPAIRKAVANAIRGMVQGLNGALEASLSPQGVKWRFEAWRTGRSFAEVVLLNNLLFRVEQIFLIHRETGLVLNHVVAPEIEAQDPDMVSGMLIAIRDFIQDSFASRGEGDNAEVLRLGEIAVWVEQEANTHVVLAAVLRGDAPVRIRERMQDTLAVIHSEYRAELKTFAGDPSPFEPTTPLLADCLEQSVASRPSSPIWAIGLLLVLLGLGILWWITRPKPPAPPPQRDFSAQEQLAARLDQTPGIVVLEAEPRNTRFLIRGMRDPLSPNPNTYFEGSEVDPATVDMTWEPYIALEPSLVRARALDVLAPPESISISWRPNGDLVATGAATHAWLTRNRTLFIPGVPHIDLTGVTDLTLQAWTDTVSSVESMMITFANNSTEISPAGLRTIGELHQRLEKLDLLAGELDRSATVVIEGYADTRGKSERNALLKEGRAQVVHRQLRDHPRQYIQFLERPTHVDSDFRGVRFFLMSP